MDPFWVVVIRSWQFGRGDKQPPPSCTSEMEDGEKHDLQLRWQTCHKQNMTLTKTLCASFRNFLPNSEWTNPVISTTSQPPTALLQFSWPCCDRTNNFVKPTPGRSRINSTTIKNIWPIPIWGVSLVLQRGQVRCKGWLVADGTWNATQQCRHLVR